MRIIPPDHLGGHTMMVSLSLTDTPVGTSRAASAVPFPVNYAHRDSRQPAFMDFSNFGTKWGCSWISYVEDRSDNRLQAIQVPRLAGGFENFPRTFDSNNVLHQD